MNVTAKIEELLKTNLDMIVPIELIAGDLALNFDNMNDVLRFKASSFVNQTFNKAFTPDGEDLEDESLLTLYYIIK